MKNKKIIVPLAAIAVLLVLLALVMMIDDKPSTTGVTSSGAPSELQMIGPVLELDTNTIDDITVSTADGAYTLAKKDGIWAVKDKAGISVSSASIESLASGLGRIMYADVIDDGSVAPADCMINDSSDYVSFTSELAHTTLIRGINTTDGRLTYVMLKGSDTLYLADADSVSKLFKPLSAYRHKASLSVDFDNLTAIELAGDTALSLKKGEADAENAVYNTWRLTSPIDAGARDEQIDSLIIEPLKQIDITDFAPDDGNLAAYGMGDRAQYVALTDSSGRTDKIYFGKAPDGKYYINILGKDAIYLIDPQSAPYISLKLSDIFQRNIHLVKMDRISLVTLKGQDYDFKVEFTKDGGRINGAKVSAADMNNVVFPSVCGLFADDIANETGGSELFRLTFTYTDGTSDVICFNDCGQRYLVAIKNNTKYLILKHKLDSVAKTLSGFKE